MLSQFKYLLNDIIRNSVFFKPSALSPRQVLRLRL